MTGRPTPDLMGALARKENPMFRTPTGQTGCDAYVYEAAQIANHLRVLNERAVRLAAAMADELPETVDNVRWAIPSKEHPDASIPTDRESLARILRMSGTADNARFLEHVACVLRRGGTIDQRVSD